MEGSLVEECESAVGIEGMERLTLLNKSVVVLHVGAPAWRMRRKVFQAGGSGARKEALSAEATVCAKNSSWAETKKEKNKWYLLITLDNKFNIIAN